MHDDFAIEMAVGLDMYGLLRYNYFRFMQTNNYVVAVQLDT